MLQFSKIRHLFLFSVLTAGCKTASTPGKQQAPLPDRAKSEASPQESTETHWNIARAMFPAALPKTTNISCFRTLTPKMSMHAVVQKCGRPDEEVGSGGVFIFVWHMPAGLTVSISTPSLERIGDVKYTNESDN